MSERNGLGAGAEPDLPRRQLLAWIWRLPVIAALGGGAYAAWRAIRVHFGKVEPSEEPAFKAIEPVRVAELRAFEREWSSATFSAADISAIAIRLPEPTAASLAVDGAHYAAFSRVCTHQGCIVDLNTSPEAIALATNYRSDEPALVCPCHLSVFLPLQLGKAVSGPAVEPLPRLRLTAHEQTLFAVGLETQA